MNIKLLEPELAKHLGWNKARISFLSMFLSALFVARSVNLKKIANKFYGTASCDSKYKRVQRFFRLFDIDYISIAKLIGLIIPCAKKLWILAIDRTNWKFGKTNINILTLGVVYKGITFPLIWIMLDKRGNSNTIERLEILEQFIDIFGEDKIECLLADREFVGNIWFNHLINEKGIRFRIRIKNNEYISKRGHGDSRAKNFFRDIKIGQEKILKGKRSLWGHRIYLCGTKSPDGKMVIIATNIEPETALIDYAKRWGIESMFKCLKTSGFNFEDTHLTDLKRIKKLMALLAIAFTISVIAGDIIHTEKPIKLKKHGRKEKSIFRVGLDFLEQVVLFLGIKCKSYQKLICILSCT